MTSEQQYLDLLKKVLHTGEPRADRTGTGTLALFGGNMKFDLRDGFPLLTTKKLHWKSIVHELLWFISGSSNTKYLNDNGISIWNEWEDEHGDLGPIYGVQWRSWHTNFRYIDQLSNLIDNIKNNPTSRRHIVSAWNVGELDHMALPPCHMMFQCYVYDDRYLDLQMYQRSCDMFLGVPYNIASYSILLHMLASLTNLKPRYFNWVGGDIHIYKNHIRQVGIQLERECLPLPTVNISNRDKVGIDDFTFDDIILSNYNAHPHIRGEISI